MELNQGRTRLGRNATNELRIQDPSVSGSHCEIVVSENSIFVRDLGSTNGTCIDGQLVQEGLLQPGQALQLGAVRLVLETDLEQIPARVAIPEISIPQLRVQSFLRDGAPACLNHLEESASFRCTKCHHTFCEECISTVGLSGGKSMHFCVLCGGPCKPMAVVVSAAVAPEGEQRRSLLGRLTHTLKVVFKR